MMIVRFYNSDNGGEVCNIINFVVLTLWNVPHYWTTHIYLQVVLVQDLSRKLTTNYIHHVSHVMHINIMSPCEFTNAMSSH